MKQPTIKTIDRKELLLAYRGKDADMWMSEPFTVNDSDGNPWSAATDGKVLVAFKADEGLAVLAPKRVGIKEKISQLISEPPKDVRTVKIGRLLDWCEMTLKPDHCDLCRGRGDKDCPDCEGSGRVECSKCGHEDDCEKCDGKGSSGPCDCGKKFPNQEQYPGRIGVCIVDRQLFGYPLCGFDREEIARVEITEPEATIRIFGAGWIVCVQPMKESAMERGTTIHRLFDEWEATP